MLLQAGEWPSISGFSPLHPGIFLLLIISLAQPPWLPPARPPALPALFHSVLPFPHLPLASFFPSPSIASPCPSLRSSLLPSAPSLAPHTPKFPSPFFLSHPSSHLLSPSPNCCLNLKMSKQSRLHFTALWAQSLGSKDTWAVVRGWGLKAWSRLCHNQAGPDILSGRARLADMNQRDSGDEHARERGQPGPRHA